MFVLVIRVKGAKAVEKEIDDRRRAKKREIDIKSAGDRARERSGGGGAFFARPLSRGRTRVVSPSLSVPPSDSCPLSSLTRTAGRGGARRYRLSERVSKRADNNEKVKEDESGEKGRSVGVGTPGGQLPANDAGPIKRARFVTLRFPVSAAICNSHLRRIAACVCKKNEMHGESSSSSSAHLAS